MFTWALVGSPNSGKTTLYNWLTGSKSKTVNYPGSTVEYNVGLLRAELAARIDNADVRIVDTPGIYSLNPQSDDEQVTHDVLFTENKVEKLHGVIVVLDITQLSRHLLIAKQILDSSYPTIFVVTMRDLIEKEGVIIQLDELKNELGPHVILFDGILGQGLDEVVSLLPNTPAQENEIKHHADWTIEQQTRVIEWAEALAQKVLPERNDQKSAAFFTNKLDKFMTHPLFGLIIFFSCMTLLFASIYWAAAPVMDIIDVFFSNGASYATEHIPGLFGEFIGAGLIAAIGGVVIFVPQIFILFFGIGLLESTGYLARVAALIDKPLSMVGLGGRSFVPLLSGFACSIPAIMATRNITSKKERLMAQSIIPFMTCSARLPVYALLISFLYGDENPIKAGFIMAIMYFGAIVVGAIAANIISIFIKDTTKPRLVMELPLYRRPRFSLILMQSLSKSKSFVVKAGPIIFGLALVLWFATNFPRPEVVVGEEPPSSVEMAKDSYAAQVGRVVEPIFKPMGVDWRVGFALISAFAAREVFVSALALMLNITDEDEEAQSQGLIGAMKNARFEDGSPIFTLASVVGILVFFMIALQCTSTVGILKREMGSWKPALMQLFFSNLVAYCLAVTVVLTLKQFGF
jgi:ferrous iron transport protein B